MAAGMFLCIDEALEVVTSLFALREQRWNYKAKSFVVVFGSYFGTIYSDQYE